MSLCTNRVDGDYLTVFDKYINTCYQDVITVPLPALVLLLGFGLCFALQSRMPGMNEEDDLPTPLKTFSSKSKESSYTTDYSNPGKYANLDGNAGGSTTRKGRNGHWTGGWIGILVLGMNVVVVVGLGAMHVWQIVRLSAALLGIGLLPLLLPALTLLLLTLLLPTHASNAFAGRPRPHSIPWTIVVYLFVLAMAVVEGAELYVMSVFDAKYGSKMGDGSGKKTYAWATRELDIGILCGLYCLLLVVYTALNVIDRRRRS